MPLYAYNCKGCGHAFEGQIKMADRDFPTTQACPECGEMKVERGLTVAGITSGTPDHIGSKVPDGFKDILRNIKKTAGKKCTIDI